jgi:hypothetical protein
MVNLNGYRHVFITAGRYLAGILRDFYEKFKDTKKRSLAGELEAAFRPHASLISPMILKNPSILAGRTPFSMRLVGYRLTYVEVWRDLGVRDRLDEIDGMPQPPEAKEILEHGPGGAPLKGVSPRPPWLHRFCVDNPGRGQEPAQRPISIPNQKSLVLITCPSALSHRLRNTTGSTE